MSKRTTQGAGGRHAPPAASGVTRTWWRDAASLAAIAALLGAVYLLPPDTSLADVQRVGTLRVCVPVDVPPLVTGDPAAPGIDVELVQRLADGLGVRLQLVSNTAVGRDFNPRNWRVNRAQCVLIAGGVVASPLTRSFLETLPPHLATGWAAVRLRDDAVLDGATVAFFAGASGLDRLTLSRFLREQGASVQVVNRRADVVQGLIDGRFDIGVSEAITARQIAGLSGGEAIWLPEALGRYPVAIGMWKGDLTLKRRLEAELRVLRNDGVIRDLIDRYDVVPIASLCDVCRPDQ
jgi:ABC-type amino acid transport substrate-binding protein